MKQLSKIIIFGIIAILSFSFVSNVAFADSDVKSQIKQGITDAGGKDDDGKEFTDWIADMTKYILFFVGVLAVLVIIYSGVLFILAAGNPQTIAKARSSLIYAVVGLIITILAYAIVNFVVSNVSKK